MSDKTFIGRVFPGNFHKDGTTHLRLILTGEDLNNLNDLMYEGMEAKSDNKPLPPGVGEYNGTLQIKLEIKSNRDGDKLYANLDTYQKHEGQAAAKPAQAAEPEKKRPARF